MLNSTLGQPIQDNLIILSTKDNFNWCKDILNDSEANIVRQQAAKEASYTLLSGEKRFVIVEFIKEKDDLNKTKESIRKTAADRITLLRQLKAESVTIVNKSETSNHTLSYAEGLALGNYQFLKYFTDKSEKESSLKKITVDSASASAEEVARLNIICESVCIARDLVNEPLTYLTAVQLSEEFKSLGSKAGFSVTVLNKDQITALGMGGLLAVNRGSINPPTFTIMEWKPENASNTQPIILVGKGVVFDTGGVSLKPTANSMDYMKCDMAGSAAVGALMYAIASSKLPLHVIGLCPSTDNRPGEDAYVPGDVLKMYSGKTVEVLNTDAEGRLILADALHYAKQYNPELVMDIATLTGAAGAAIGPVGIVYMGTASDNVKNELVQSGYAVYERLVEFPLWDEYNEMIKSEIADIKNIGGPYGGAITAGKFLEHFIDYPWVHFDIAGSGFIHTADGYRVKGGSGVTVRLIYDFLSKRAGK